MPSQMNVAVENATTSVTPIFTTAVANPALTGVYLYSLADQPGVVAANNFVSLFNPVGSGKLAIIAGFFISSYSVGQATATAPLRGWRITAASGGTLATNSTDVAKFNTSFPNTTMELRNSNPTVTKTTAFFNSPPPIGTGAGTAFVHAVEAPPGAGTFLCKAGEGVVVSTDSGDVDQHFNMTIAWAEING